MALRSHVNNSGPVSYFPHGRLVGAVYRLRLHHHPRASAVRIIIYFHMFISGVITDVDAFQADQPLIHRPSDDAGMQPLLNHFRK